MADKATLNRRDFLKGAGAVGAKRLGSEGAHKKVVVETFNGASVLDTRFADILQDVGFVRLPDDMRLYVSPF